MTQNNWKLAQNYRISISIYIYFYTNTLTCITPPTATIQQSVCVSRQTTLVHYVHSQMLLRHVWVFVFISEKRAQMRRLWTQLKSFHSRSFWFLFSKSDIGVSDVSGFSDSCQSVAFTSQRSLHTKCAFGINSSPFIIQEKVGVSYLSHRGLWWPEYRG